jgi:hypothetical protein
MNRHEEANNSIERDVVKAAADRNDAVHAGRYENG